jgi:hypothetical protein
MKMDKLLQAMRRKEQRRKRKATKDFLAKMDRLEAEALDEIEASVGSAKHKASGITEKLYGPSSNIIERMLGTENE